MANAQLWAALGTFLLAAVSLIAAARGRPIRTLNDLKDKADKLDLLECRIESVSDTLATVTRLIAQQDHRIRRLVSDVQDIRDGGKT